MNHLPVAHLDLVLIRLAQQKRAVVSSMSLLVLVFSGLGGCLSTHDDYREHATALVGLARADETSSIAEPSLSDEMPADFTLSITVVAPGVDETALTTLTRAEKPARYIVEPDSVLRAASGPGATPMVFPGQTRTLNEAQLRRIWRLVRETGLLDSGSITQIPTTETFFPPPGRSTALISITANGQVRAFAVRLPVGDPPSVATTQLIDAVAELAWIPR